MVAISEEQRSTYSDCIRERKPTKIVNQQNRQEPLNTKLRLKVDCELNWLIIIRKLSQQNLSDTLSLRVDDARKSPPHPCRPLHLLYTSIWYTIKKWIGVMRFPSGFPKIGRNSHSLGKWFILPFLIYPLFGIQ